MSEFDAKQARKRHRERRRQHRHGKDERKKRAGCSAVKSRQIYTNVVKP